MIKPIVFIALSVLLATNASAENTEPLTLTVTNTGSNSFHVNSTLLYGESEAVVVDAGFTRADALRIAANVLDAGKPLTRIFISQADPDYYFGAETLKQVFPTASVLTTPDVRQVIEKKLAIKLETWSPRMGMNAPVDPVIPDEYDGSSFPIDGHDVQIKGTQGALAHRPYLWIPSLEALIGNIGVFGEGMHVWTADTQTPQQLNAWLEQLEEMQSLNPKLVVPGHMKPGTELSSASIQHTQDYLQSFIAAKSASNNSEELIAAMLSQYPADETPLSLSIGAKVHMGEMKW